MGLNTKCPIHGNEHPDFLCPSRKNITYITKDRVMVYEPYPSGIKFYVPELDRWFELDIQFLGKLAGEWQKINPGNDIKNYFER